MSDNRIVFPTTTAATSTVASAAALSLQVFRGIKGRRNIRAQAGSMPADTNRNVSERITRFNSEPRHGRRGFPGDAGSDFSVGAIDTGCQFLLQRQRR